MTEYALTTIDNPYDPFEQFVSWYMYDIEKGWNSCEYLARLARTSDQLSDEENNAEIEQAIDRIVELDFTNMRKKVKRKAS